MKATGLHFPDIAERVLIEKDRESIYFIGHANANVIKIGSTKGPPNHRIMDIQVGFPWPLEVFDVVPGSRDEEKSLHKLITDADSDANTSGEWFVLDHPVVAKVIREFLAVRRAAFKSSPMAREKAWVKQGFPGACWPQDRVRAIR